MYDFHDLFNFHFYEIGGKKEKHCSNLQLVFS